MVGVYQDTIAKIESGNGNPKFENLCMLITCLQIPADTIFYPDTSHNYDLEKIQIALSECTEEELNDIIPIVVSHINSFVKLIRKQRKMI